MCANIQTILAFVSLLPFLELPFRVRRTVPEKADFRSVFLNLSGTPESQWFCTGADLSTGPEGNLLSLLPGECFADGCCPELKSISSSLFTAKCPETRLCNVVWGKIRAEIE